MLASDFLSPAVYPLRQARKNVLGEEGWGLCNGGCFVNLPSPRHPM